MVRIQTSIHKFLLKPHNFGRVRGKRRLVLSFPLVVFNVFKFVELTSRGRRPGNDIQFIGRLSVMMSWLVISKTLVIILIIDKDNLLRGVGAAVSWLNGTSGQRKESCGRYSPSDKAARGTKEDDGLDGSSTLRLFPGRPPPKVSLPANNVRVDVTLPTDALTWAVEGREWLGFKLNGFTPDWRMPFDRD